MKTINTKGLDIGEASFFVPSHGDCLDSPSSPMRIHEGDIIGLHDIEIKKVGDYKGKLIAVVLRRNVGGCSRFMVKEMVGTFRTQSFVPGVKTSEGVILQCYRPKRMQMYFCFEDIERVFAVDCHFPKEKLSINET